MAATTKRFFSISENQEMALDTKGYVQYNYDAGTNLQWYEFTVVQVYIGMSWLPVVGVDWYEFAMEELTIKHYLGQAWLITL